MRPVQRATSSLRRSASAWARTPGIWPLRPARLWTRPTIKNGPGKRRDRHRRAADHLHVRGHQQRHLQRARRAGAVRAFHPRSSPGRPRQERRGRITMKNFTYFRPKTAEDAVGLLDDKWGTTELLA